MNDAIKISVVIPCYNSAEFIEKGLVSVCEQSYRQFEVIISDDASTDITLQHAEEILKRYPDVAYQLLANSHSGPGGNRNKGIQAARYNWVAFLDSDDYWAEDKLQKVVGTQQRTGANLIFHNESFYQEGSNKQQKINYVECYDTDKPLFLALFRRNFLSPSAIVLKKELLLDAGMFDLDMHYGEDYDLWLKIALLPKIKVAPLNEYLSYYQVRLESLTSNIDEQLRSLLEILSRYGDEVKRLSPDPAKELSRFKGVIYTRCGWGYCKQAKIVRGVFYIAKGLFLDIRSDVLKKIMSYGYKLASKSFSTLCKKLNIKQQRDKE